MRKVRQEGVFSGSQFHVETGVTLPKQKPQREYYRVKRVDIYEKVFGSLELKDNRSLYYGSVGVSHPYKYTERRFMRFKFRVHPAEIKFTTLVRLYKRRFEADVWVF